jgi:hypothetical protein
MQGDWARDINISPHLELGGKKIRAIMAEFPGNMD